MIILLKIDETFKEELLIRCPHCANTLISRNGSYKRAHPHESVPVRVPRFLCKSPLCPWVTFSLLPPPFLPIIRHFFRTLDYCHDLCIIKKASQAEGARQMILSRGVIKRLSAFGGRFFPWFNHEKKIADWDLDPHRESTLCWPDFTWCFSRAFYPKRWRKDPPT
ncbi:transposase [Myxococcota bacterium]|nr:transposase [Myxococcota bacterium]